MVILFQSIPKIGQTFSFHSTVNKCVRVDVRACQHFPVEFITNNKFLILNRNTLLLAFYWVVLLSKYQLLQARSQPARWGGGGLNLDGWNTRRTPPPWTLSAWRHQFEKRPHSWTFTGTPPLDIARLTSSTYSKGGTKLPKGGTKLLKGGTKSLGWATGGGGGRPTPPPPPMATGLYRIQSYCLY